MSRSNKALQYAIKFAQEALSPQINPPPAGGGVGPLASLPPGSGGEISPEHLALLRSAGNPQIPASASPPAPGSPGHEVWNMGDPSVGSLEDAAPAGMAGGRLPAWAQPATIEDAAPASMAGGQLPAWAQQINPPPAGGGVGPLASLPSGSGGEISPEHLALLRSAGNPPPGSPGHEVWNMGDPPVGSLEDAAPAGMAGGQLPAWTQPATMADVAPSTWSKGQTAPAWGAYDPSEASTSAESPAKKLDKISAYLAEHMFLPELLGMQKTASGLPREQDRLAMAMAFGSALAEQDLAPLRKLAMRASVDLITKRAQDISPEVAHALLGGGLGAAAGGLAGYGLSDKKNRGRNALLAAIVGGAGGAAAGHHFSDRLPDVTGTRGEGGRVSKVLERARKAQSSFEARRRGSEIDQAIEAGLLRGKPPGVGMREVSPREGRPDVIGQSRERLPHYRAPMPPGVRMRETLLPEGFDQETPHGGGALGGLGDAHLRALRNR